MEKKNKRRKGRGNRLFLLLLLILATGVMLTTSTYAWFTSNKAVTVSSLQVNIESKNGLQISANGTEWKALLSNDDIKNTGTSYAGSVNQIPLTMEPVSTIGTVDENGKMEMFYGSIAADETTGEYQLTATKETDAEGETGKYIAFDMFLKVNETTDVVITKSSGVTALDDLSILNASRIAFVNLGTVADGSNVSTIHGINGGITSTVKIWEPNYNAHTNAAISNASDNYGIDGLTTNEEDPVTYNGVKAAIATPQSLDSTDANYFSEVTPTWTTKDDFATNGTPFDFLTLSAGITKIRVYMWVEGQDIDCENNASGGNIKYDLQFAVKETGN